MKSCRTASVFAMGVVVAVMAVAGRREAMTTEIPPLTRTSPDAAPLLAPTNASISANAPGALDTRRLAPAAGPHRKNNVQSALKWPRTKSYPLAPI